MSTGVLNDEGSAAGTQRAVMARSRLPENSKRPTILDCLESFVDVRYKPLAPGREVRHEEEDEEGD